MKLTGCIMAVLSIASALLGTAVCGQSSAAADSAARWQAAFTAIEKMYTEHARKNNIPGLAFGLVVRGKLVYAKGMGYSDITKKVPVTTSSVYRIASMTKSFTAMAILALRDEGKFDLDDPIAKFIPEIKNTQALTPDAPPITIRHLLTHTAGFPEDNPWGDRQLQRTDQELVDFIAKGLSLSSSPGVDYEYSNLGFAMLGRIITVASGEHYEQYIRKKIFDPLSMKHTFWEYTDVPETMLVNGYRLVNGEWVKEEMLHSGAYGAMGGMLTSIEDFARYMALHMSAWPPGREDARVIRKGTLRDMHRPGLLSYLYATPANAKPAACPRLGSYNDGLFYSKDCNGREMIGHSGGLPGFGTHWTFLPQYGIGVVSFCNLTYAATSALNTRVIDTLVARCHLKPWAVPASAILEERKRQLVRLLPHWKGAEQSGIFSENFFLDYFTDSLRREAQDLFARAGRIISVGEMIPDNQLRGNFLLYGEHTNIRIRFTLSPENPPLIQEYDIRAWPKTDSAFLKYGLKTIANLEEYRKWAAADSSQELLSLSSVIPGIHLDIRYATKNNIMNKPVYSKAAAFMRRPAALALKAVQDELRPKGYALKIYDGYRPYAVTVQFYEQFRDTVFVASPFTGSRHNRGCAVDLTLVDLKTGNEVKMPTPYDSFTKEAAADFPFRDKKVLSNRELLKEVMIRHGFKPYASEWWHFDFAGWEQYPVMNLTFEMLQ